MADKNRIKNQSDFYTRIFVEREDAYDLGEPAAPERFIVVDDLDYGDLDIGGALGGGGDGGGDTTGGPGGKEEYDPGFGWMPVLGNIPDILNDFSSPIGTITVLPDGSLEVSVELLLTDIPSATGYEIRIKADADTDWTSVQS